jgi:uncharacterized protein
MACDRAWRVLRREVSLLGLVLGLVLDCVAVAMLLAPVAAQPAAKATADPAARPAAKPNPTASCPPTPKQPTQAQIQQALGKPRDRGLLWRITRDGRSSYLYGTLHLGKLDWIATGPALSAALRGVDVLALELDMTDTAVLREAATLMQARPDQALPEGLARRLKAQLERACVAGTAIEAMHPVMQAVTIGLLLARHDGLDASYGSEMILSAVAREGGKSIVSLETARGQMEVLLAQGRADLQLAIVDRAVDQLERGVARPVMSRLVRAWEVGDLEELERYGQWCECMGTEADREVLRRLNDGRNPAMADAIEARHRDGTRVLAAIGALHMTGPAALPRLMTQRGFRVERVPYR